MMVVLRGSFSESGIETESMKKNQRTMTKDEFSKVLTKFSGCVEEAVREAFVPAFQWSMEQNLSSRRSSEIISSSPHGVERGETLSSPSERSSHSQRPDSEISSCSSSIGSACTLGLMATSPFRSSKNSGLDEASKTMEDLKHGLKCLTMVDLSEVSPAPLSEPLRDLFCITKDRIFENVHSEVTSSLSNIVFPKKMIYLSRKTTLNLTNEILDHSLIKINSTLTELYCDAESHQEPLFPRSTSEKFARELLSATYTRMQDALELYMVSDWLSASEGSPVDLHEELEEMLPIVTAKVVAAVFGSMLTISSEGNPKEGVSETPLLNFVQAVHDKIKSDLFKAATLRQSSGTCSSNGWNSPSECSSAESLTWLCSYYPHTGVETAHSGETSSLYSQSSGSSEDGTAVHWLNEEDEEGRPINLLSVMATKIPEVTSTVIYKSLQLQERLRLEPCRERILETIICPCTDEDHDPFRSEMQTEQLFTFSCDAFLVEVSKMVTSIITKDTAEIVMARQAKQIRNSGCERLNLSTRPSFHKRLESGAFAGASDFVRAVMGQIKVSFEEELKLADLSDTALYTKQVRMVSDKVLQSIQATVKDVFVGNLFMRAQAAMTPFDAAELSCSLLSESIVVLKTIIENITVKLPLFSVRDSEEAVTGQFLQSVVEHLDLLFMWQLSNSYVQRPEALSDLTVTDVFKKVAEELMNGEAFQQEASSESVLKTQDTDFIPQSCHELVHELIEDVMLERSADVDSGKERTSSSSDQSIISTLDLLDGNVQRTAEVASAAVDHVVESVSAALFVTSGCTTINLQGNSVSGCEVGLDNEDYGSKRTSKKTLKFPKIKFPKKRRNRIEPGTVVSQDCTQERPVPTVDGPSKSTATSTSTAIPVPVRRTLFSRVIKVVSKVFRK
ncbi:hypothetical protein AOLI_G00187300 [Acnodon oligacanthus]